MEDRVRRVVPGVLRCPHPLRDLGSGGSVRAEQFHEELGARDDVVRGCGEHVVEARLPGGQTKAHVGSSGALDSVGLMLVPLPANIPGHELSSSGHANRHRSVSPMGKVISTDPSPVARESVPYTRQGYGDPSRTTARTGSRSDNGRTHDDHRGGRAARPGRPSKPADQAGRARLPPRRRTSTSSGCAGSRARSAGSSGWSTRTSTASTYSPRSRHPPRPCKSFALQLLEEHLRHCVAHAAVRGRRGNRREGRGSDQGDRPAAAYLTRTGVSERPTRSACDVRAARLIGPRSRPAALRARPPP